jgi:inorganic triphosphatase YgiF
VFEGFAPGQRETVEMEDRYVDTVDGRLARRGFAARLRRIGDVTVISLKTLGRPAAGGSSLHRRVEHEGPADGGLDPVPWAPSTARRLLMHAADGAPLEERFTIHQLRRRRDLVARDGVVQLSLDRIEIRRGHQLLEDRRAVLEAELTEGGSALLDRVAHTLESTGLVRPELRSKEELARAALALAEAAP